MNSLEQNVLQSAEVINLLKKIKNPILSAFIKSIIICLYDLYLWRYF